MTGENRVEGVFGEEIMSEDDICREAFAESIWRPGECRRGRVKGAGLCSRIWHFGSACEYFGSLKTPSTIAYVVV
jgi:hypothetical protein